MTNIKGKIIVAGAPEKVVVEPWGDFIHEAEVSIDAYITDGFELRLEFGEGDISLWAERGIALDLVREE